MIPTNWADIFGITQLHTDVDNLIPDVTGHDGEYLKNVSGVLEWAAAGGGTFSGNMDDIPDGAVYIKTENNYTDSEKSKLSAIESGATNNTKAIGSEVDTGTDDVKFLTSKAIEDSAYIKAAYVDGKVSDSITDGVTTIAPSQNAVFDALALKAPLADPTFTGTVSGITKSMVGLSNVDNTTDAGKPVSTAQQTALDLKAPLASPAFTGTPSFGSGIPAANLPNGITNGNVAEQSQIVVSATNYYITKSNIILPATLKAGMVVGTKFTWTIYMSKTAAGTGVFQLSIYRGTNGSTSDTQDVLQTLGTQTAVIDSMCINITLVVTATGASGSYFWTMCPTHAAATATGFGIATGTTGLFSGTVSGVAMNTSALNFGIGFKATTGTPTIRVVQVQAQAINID